MLLKLFFFMTCLMTFIFNTYAINKYSLLSDKREYLLTISKESITLKEKTIDIKVSRDSCNGRSYDQFFKSLSFKLKKLKTFMKKDKIICKKEELNENCRLINNLPNQLREEAIKRKILCKSKKLKGV